MTNSDGIAEFEFNAEPPYGDYQEYGEVSLRMSISSNGIISDDSLTKFNTAYNSGTTPSYSYADDDGGVPWWMYLVAVLVQALHS